MKRLVVLAVALCLAVGFAGVAQAKTMKASGNTNAVEKNTTTKSSATNVGNDYPTPTKSNTNTFASDKKMTHPAAAPKHHKGHKHYKHYKHHRHHKKV